MMRRFGITLACLVGLATPAAAAQLASPPVTQSGGSLVKCSIANVSGSGAKVGITVVENDATLTALKPALLAAGASRSAFDFCPSTCTRPRCVFTTSTAASGFRASACVATYTNTNTDKICLPAQ